MKCRILTAHGYLSFQPDGTVQYRPTPGAWEELTIEAWDIQIIPPEPINPEPPPVNQDWPYGIQPSEDADYVYAIKQALLADGKNLSGPCGAFEIVKNVAWGCQSLNTGIGILSKPDGNNCQGYSTDIVCYKDFSAGSTRIVDILSDAGGTNDPMWIEKGEEENVDMDRWRPPISPA